ncbi:hypothetical protein [Scytonema sp. PCC 10023]|uniref:hypothetical protein n=1 Tax=Scytonema sp. PCC 10023 TaxID=1680591 RepID=UPI0039C698C9
MKLVNVPFMTVVMCVASRAIAPGVIATLPKISRSAPLTISSDYRPQRLATLPTSPPSPKSGRFKLEMPSLPPARAIPPLNRVPFQWGTYGKEVKTCNT